MLKVSKRVGEVSMAGSRKQKTISCFYCISCGKQGIPIWRNRGSLRERGHRKALYCTNCRMTINHVEVRTEEEKRRFYEDFAAGKYAEEAEKSRAFAKGREDRNDQQ